MESIVLLVGGKGKLHCMQTGDTLSLAPVLLSRLLIPRLAAVPMVILISLPCNIDFLTVYIKITLRSEFVKYNFDESKGKNLYIFHD